MAGSDGKMRVFSTSGKPIFDLDGNCTGYRGTSTDVTRKEELARLKREFISTASHELRTPLTSIRGALGLIAANAVGEIPETASELISIAERNCNRLLLLVNDILDMDKIESGAMAYHFERLRLNEAIRKAIEANRTYGDEFGVSFKLTPSPVDGWVEADEERLNQIIANLLSNAAKFSPKGSSVDILVESLGTIFRISVRDEGPGIPEEFRDQIFEKFTQADGSNTKQVSGTGLGLSITKSIVEGHGGTIDYETEIGRGTTFFFDLPQAS
ncbi:MAG: HAMP domain-containing histidine kinase [Alphaproteobacteria bacterium]|nr:HAMP domain-containing histidine kinase [Alphaproteobacteria bacterium]